MKTQTNDILKEFKNDTPVYYQDMKINTYQFYKEKIYSESPIIEVYNPNEIQNISLFGQGLNSALKIKAAPLEIYTTILPKL